MTVSHNWWLHTIGLGRSGLCVQKFLVEVAEAGGWQMESSGCEMGLLPSGSYSEHRRPGAQSCHCQAPGADRKCRWRSMVYLLTYSRSLVIIWKYHCCTWGMNIHYFNGKAPIIPIFQNTPLPLSRSRPDDLSIQERKELPNQETEVKPHQRSLASITETPD